MTSTELDLSFGSRIGLAVACALDRASNSPASAREGKQNCRRLNAIDTLSKVLTLLGRTLTYVNHAADVMQR